MTRTVDVQGAGARWLVWGAYAGVLLLAPLVFSQGAALSILSQMGTAMVLALSYNMLLGQGGMLSFGHAVYSGLGAYVAMHALNLAAQNVLPLPVSLVPLAGGLGGMFFGIVFGYISTRKAGTGFAMITLGMVELVSASALMFPGFFGGEGGISGNRVIGEPVLGISFGPQIEVYYLIAAWLLIATAAMFAFTRTPLGRMLNAVRDNPERAEFIGYDPRRVRHLAVVLSAFFAGISGGLAAINFEIVSAENVSVARSAWVLLSTYIGGIGYFAGPLLGAIAGVLLTVVLPAYTKAWQMYLGGLFIVIVLFAPGGLAGMAMGALQFARLVRQARLACGSARACKLLGLGIVLTLAAALVIAGVVLAMEMLYQLSLESADGVVIRLFGMDVDAAVPGPWLLAAGLAVAGGTALVLGRRGMVCCRESLGLGNAGNEAECWQGCHAGTAHVTARRGTREPI